MGLRDIGGGQMCEPRQPRSLPSSKRLTAVLNPIVQAATDFRRKNCNIALRILWNVDVRSQEFISTVEERSVPKVHWAGCQ